MDMSYTKQEAQEINLAYAKFEEWANKHSMSEYLDEGWEKERRQFSGNWRNTQARVSILRVAYDAMFNENQPVKPSTIHMRPQLAMIYLAISFRIAGWEGRSNYGDKLEALSKTRDAINAAVQTHDVAFNCYWRTVNAESDEIYKELMSPTGIEGAL